MFWVWSSVAGSPDKDRALRFPNVEAITFTTEDGRVLRGFKIKATTPAGSAIPPKGYLLVAQGNAMLADQLIGAFADYASQGYDVYVYDYRGYGLSEGKRRLKAIASDYQALTHKLNTSEYQQKLLYGISFGGIVMLNVIGKGHAYDAAVIDSTPSRVSPYGCPDDYDPVNNLPEDSAQIMIVAGDRDRVVTIEDMKELLEQAEHRSATVLRHKEFAHPFMDVDPSIGKLRKEKIQRFLLNH